MVATLPGFSPKKLSGTAGGAESIHLSSDTKIRNYDERKQADWRILSIRPTLWIRHNLFMYEFTSEFHQFGLTIPYQFI